LGSKLHLLQLKKGADGARGDDANTLKTAVATWLNEQQPHPVPLLAINEKQERGFNHDLTGKLLCPVDYDWLDTLYVHQFVVLFLILIILQVFVMPSGSFTHVMQLLRIHGQRSCIRKRNMTHSTHRGGYSKVNFL